MITVGPKAVLELKSYLSEQALFSECSFCESMIVSGKVQLLCCCRSRNLLIIDRQHVAIKPLWAIVTHMFIIDVQKKSSLAQSVSQNCWWEMGN
jgi:hypothetical protein